MATRQRALPSATRADDIVVAARQLFAVNGYSETTMAQVAKRVGVVEAAIYRYHPSKRDLLVAVIRDFHEPNTREARAMLGGIEGLRNRLRFVVWWSLRTLTEQPDICRLIITHARSMDGYEDSGMADLNRRYSAIALEVVRDGQRSGQFRTDVPATLVRDLLFGGAEHLAWKALNGTARIDLERTADQVTEFLWRGLAA